MEIDNIGFDLVKTGELVCEMGEGIYFPTYLSKTSAASILFVNGISSIAHFNRFIKMNKDKSDMQLLYDYRTFYGSYAKSLPVDLKDEKYKHLGIFDLMSLGHYLFGLDKRILKTLNRNLKITNQEIYNNLIEPISEFFIKKNTLYVRVEEKVIKVNNVHIHSKIHNKLIRPYYMEYLLHCASSRRSIIIELNYFEIIKNNIIGFLLKVKTLFY